MDILFYFQRFWEQRIKDIQNQYFVFLVHKTLTVIATFPLLQYSIYFSTFGFPIESNVQPKLNPYGRNKKDAVSGLRRVNEDVLQIYGSIEQGNPDTAVSRLCPCWNLQLESLNNCN